MWKLYEWRNGKMERLLNNRNSIMGTKSHYIVSKSIDLLLNRITPPICVYLRIEKRVKKGGTTKLYSNERQKGNFSFALSLTEDSFFI